MAWLGLFERIRDGGRRVEGLKMSLVALEVAIMHFHDSSFRRPKDLANLAVFSLEFRQAIETPLSSLLKL